MNKCNHHIIIDGSVFIKNDYLTSVKTLIFIFTVVSIFSCKAQDTLKIDSESTIDFNYSIKELDSAICANNRYSEIDENDIKLKDILTRIRLKSANQCGMNINEKDRIYIEELFQNFYSGIIIKNNDVCQITTSLSGKEDTIKNKVKIDSIHKVYVYARKMTLEELKRENVDYYYKYKIVSSGKLTDLMNCLKLANISSIGEESASNYFSDNKFYLKNIPIYYKLYFEYPKIERILNTENKAEIRECLEKINNEIGMGN